MKNKIFLITILAFALFLSASVSAVTSITNCSDLQAMNLSLTGSYILANNIDCSDTTGWDSGAGFYPIGIISPYFSGSLNGQGYNITNLYINRATAAGLFGVTANGVNISNLGLINVSITGTTAVGGLIGFAYNLNITSSFVTGRVSGTGSNVGGFIGDSYGFYNITNSYSNVNVSGGVNSVGGLVGYSESQARIENSYSLGNVSATSWAGGIIGYSVGANLFIKNSNSSSLVTGSGSGLGGLVGYLVGANSEINQSSSHGNIYGALGYVGGIVGSNPGAHLNNVYATGNITSGAAYTGGIAGYLGVRNITNSYFAGNVTGTTSVGGIIGYGEGSGILNCNYTRYNLVGTDYLGGLQGQGAATSFILNSFTNISLISTGSYVGGLAGTNGQTYNSYATGNIKGVSIIGGLVGSAWAIMNNSYATGNITGTGSYFGGLVGLDYSPGGVISNSYATGNITGGAYTGGLAGYITQNITNSYATGWVTGTSNVGGLIGHVEGGAATLQDLNYTSHDVIGSAGSVGGLIGDVNNVNSKIMRCFSTVNVSGGSIYVGGLIGSATATINMSYSIGNVTGLSGYVGGLLGHLYGGILANSYSTSTVLTAAGSYAGGLVGLNYAPGGLITNSYSTGNVTALASYAGGLVGYNAMNITNSFSASRNVTGPVASTGGLVAYNIDNGPDPNITNSYWNQYSGAPIFSVRINDGVADAYAIQNNISYFQGNVNQSNPMNLWDFSGVWQKRANNFPILAWQGLGDAVAPQLDLNKIDNDLLLSSTSIIFNFTAIDAMSPPLNCYISLDNILNQTNSSVSNDTLTNFNILGIPEGSHNWSVTCSDVVGNSNSSEIRNFTIDITAPRITAIIYSPNSTDSLDPSTILIFNVTITESVANVSSVLLRYYNGTSWSNSTMTNNSATNYNTTISLIPLEVNYTFNILTNDSLGNTNSSANQTFSSYWDCSWQASSDLGAVSGWNQNRFIGNLTINNTGDSQYSDNNCNLSFHLTHNLAAGRVYFDNWASNAWLGYYDTATLPAKNNLTIQINSSFLSEVKQENLIITTSELAGRSSQGSRNTTATIVSNSAGPYLYQKISSYPTSVSLKSGEEFNLASYIRNLMGSSTININNTAYNVSFYLVTPDGITNSSGAYALNYSNLTSSDLNYLNTNLTFSDLASMSNGLQQFTLKASGVNLSSSPITDASENSYLTESINITFLCYNVSDSVIVTSCGSLDGDYVAPTTTVTSSSSGGGGGGGSISSSEKIGEVYELIRGQEKSFKFQVKNKYNSSMRNIKISVSGINSEYIKLEPSTISKLDPYQSRDIQVIITTPKYFTSRKYTLNFDIEASLVVDNLDNSYREQKSITLLIVDFTSEEAVKMINESSAWLKEVNSLGMNPEQILALFNQMNKQFQEYDFVALKDTYNSLKKLYDSAIETKKILSELEIAVSQAKKEGISVLETEKMLYLAQTAYSRGDFVLALSRLKEAQLSYALETKGEFNPLYYIKNHPLQSFGILVFIAFFSLTSSLVIRLKLYRRKLRMLDEEESLIIGLMKVIQKECFEGAKLSMEEYDEAMAQYESRLNQIIQDKIKTETKLAYLFKIKGREEALEVERVRLIELMKKIQEDYLVKGNIETRIYENMLKSYSARLGEVEEEIALAEAKKGLRKGLRLEEKGFFSRVFISIISIFRKSKQEKNLESKIKRESIKEEKILEKRLIGDLGKVVDKKERQEAFLSSPRRSSDVKVGEDFWKDLKEKVRNDESKFKKFFRRAFKK